MLQSEKPKFTNNVKSKCDIRIDLCKNQNDAEGLDDSIWIFGYGSLIWKADFPYISKHAGYIKGFERRFYQNSLDHRGTPDKPGRVVTLIPSNDSESKVFGVAYRISYEDKLDVLKHLDLREKNGYKRFVVKFYSTEFEDQSKNFIIDVTMYVATEDNDSYAGNISDLDEIANQIYTAHGPSGSNKEYVYNLANSMRTLFPNQNDDHLFTLEAKLRCMEENGQKTFANV